MSSLQTVRGTRDLKGEELQRFQHIVSTSRDIANAYGLEEIETPIFEFTEVFKRTLGDTSDIVTKEMYTFEDRSGDLLTLRPEGTACIARSVISHQLFRDMPLKYFYQGPMFRHERPQKGRYRQFYQMGVEILGVSSPIADAECIAMGWQILQKLNLTDSATLELNSLGDRSSRQDYRDKLTAYFNQHKGQLSETSLTRLEKNPLRILDSKEPEDQELIANAPDMHECFNDTSKEFFATLKNYLTELEIPFTLNQKLVRGLDYYEHTVFEFTTNQLGSQNALLSGGRYDQLLKMMGGQETPGVGWGAGIDRLSLLIDYKKESPLTIGVIPLKEENTASAMQLLTQLRAQGFVTHLPYTGNLSKRFKKLTRAGCKYAIVVGGDEEEKGQVQIKNLETNEQSAVDKSTMTAFMTQ